jgi:Zn-dependent protease
MLHEAGHAFVANKLGYSVRVIYLGFLHGQCVLEAPYNQKHRSLIAWGGVTAQFVVALPLIIGAQTMGINEIYGVGPIVAFLGYISALIALINLAPSRLLDGSEAWKLIPVLVKERNRLKQKNRKNRKKSTYD